MRVIFLGTAASRPTVKRNVSALMLQREGESFLFDCGEGTQRQMMRYGTGFSLNDIFFTHLHADHFLGVIGLLRTLGLQDRREPVELWCPAGTETILHDAVKLGVERVPFPVSVNGLEPEGTLDRGEFVITPFQTQHGPRCLGYAVVEKDRLGRFEPERARALGVPEGPLWGRLHRGERVEVEGKTVEPSQLVGPPRRGRKVVYTGDTRPSAGVVSAASHADVLIHEATFTDRDAERARETLHATAREAAGVAKQAGAKALYLTHISPRHADDPRALEREARELFSGAVAAYDGLVVEVPYSDEPLPD
ncbi:MAG: ribonuclease Z [Longimicrobiaceae bacterium]